jgi:hypothetical protein
MNVTNQDQVLSEGTTIGHYEQAMLAAAIDDWEPEPRGKQALQTEGIDSWCQTKLQPQRNPGTGGS